MFDSINKLTAHMFISRLRTSSNPIIFSATAVREPTVWPLHMHSEDTQKGDAGTAIRQSSSATEQELMRPFTSRLNTQAPVPSGAMTLTQLNLGALEQGPLEGVFPWRYQA